MITYVDTSTMIKLLIDEDGTDEAARIWDEPDVVATARIGHVEARAALAAAHRQRRISSTALRSATEGLEMLWAQVSVVEIDEQIARSAGDLATAHGLRGYDAVHLAAAQAVGADVFSSADRRLCDAARSSGLHVANPIGHIVAAPVARVGADSISQTKDSGFLGIPVPTSAESLDTDHGFRVTSFTIQELTASFKDWMSTDGWIFDAEHSDLDPYTSEEQPYIGYITQSTYVKPTVPPTTIAIVIGNHDGQPGNKRDLRIYLTQTPDDELPRRSVELTWGDHSP